jgi:uncharacterized protein
VGTLVFAFAFPVLDSLLLQNAYFGDIAMPQVFGVSGIYMAIPFSMLLLFAAFFVLKDRYQ